MHNLSGNGSFPNRRRAPSPTPEPDYQKGREILNSGDFGAVESAHLPAAVKMKNVSRKLWMRQLNPRVVNTTSIGEVTPSALVTQQYLMRPGITMAKSYRFGTM